MPPRRSRYPRKGTRYSGPKRRRFGGGRSKYGRTAKLMSKSRITNAIRSRDEWKTNDLACANYNCNVAGSVTVINAIGVGATMFTRIGRVCHIRQIELQGFVHPGSVTIPTSNGRWRILLILDQSPGAAVPAIGAIFSGTGSCAMFNQENRERFRVLHEIDGCTGRVNYAVAGPCYASNTVKDVSFRKTVDLKETFKSDTATIGDIVNGAIYLVTVGSEADTAGSTLTAAIRVRFSEL